MWENYDDNYDQIMIMWKCDKCGDTYTDYEGINEGGNCTCGGTFEHAGEMYPLK